jgi:hypothetical protein
MLAMAADHAIAHKDRSPSTILQCAAAAKNIVHGHDEAT